MRIDRLNKVNQKQVEIAISEGIKQNPLSDDFLKEYNLKPFYHKFLMKSSFSVFEKDNKLGYIWEERYSNDIISIKSLYIPRGLSQIPSDYFKNNKKYLYESISTKENVSLLMTLGFSIIEESYMLEMDLSSIPFENLPSVSFQVVKSRKDISKRVSLQNDIFKDATRVPLDIYDIRLDMKQKHYIPELSIIISYNETPIGYGQIIKEKEVYTVVNFGIIAQYRNRGLGRYFLNYLITLAKNINITKLSIRVSKKNINAFALYTSVGFKQKYHILSWLRDSCKT